MFVGVFLSTSVCVDRACVCVCVCRKRWQYSELERSE